MKTKPPGRGSCTWSAAGGEPEPEEEHAEDGENVAPAGNSREQGDARRAATPAELLEWAGRHGGAHVIANPESPSEPTVRVPWGDRHGRVSWKPEGWGTPRDLAEHVRGRRPAGQKLPAPGRTGSPARPREHRRASSRQARAGPGDDASGEPPLTRRCAGCGEPFAPRTTRQRYHDAGCSNRARQRAWKARGRESDQADEPLSLYAAAVAQARRAGELDAEEALELLASPSPRVLQLLAAEMGAAT